MCFLKHRLEKAKREGLFRTLPVIPCGAVDFASNDYLGIVKNGLLSFAPKAGLGSTGSRLISGNNFNMERLEKEIADFHRASAALIFNSGYCANMGLLSAVPQRGDTILYDAFCHASIREGVWLSMANSFSFKHNNAEDLEKKLTHSVGHIFIVVESVYSMDGDSPPMEKIIELAKQYNAHIIVDEAHATGILGVKGEGLIPYLGYEKDIFARIYTFGKALGTFGAAILGPEILRTYLINYCRSFIYTTALPNGIIEAVKNAYSLFPTLEQERKQIRNLIKYFHSLSVPFEKILSETPVQGLLIGDNKKVMKVSEFLRGNNFFVMPIRKPTVPKGTERLRLILHAFNTEEELQTLADALYSYS